jgi:hypothetical protein
MEEIKLVINFIESMGFVGLLIILAVPTLRKKFGFGSESNNNSEILEHLEQYYNHDLTSFMTKIDAKLDKLDKIESHLDDLRANGVRIKK